MVVVVSASDVVVGISVVISDVLTDPNVVVVLVVSMPMVVSMPVVVSMSVIVFMSVVVSTSMVVPVPEALTLSSEVAVSVSGTVGVVVSGKLDAASFVVSCDSEDNAPVGRISAVVASSDGVNVTPGMFVKERPLDVSIGTVGNALVEVLEKRKELVCADGVCVGSRDGGTRLVMSTSDVKSEESSGTEAMAVLTGADVGTEFTVGCSVCRSVDVGTALADVWPSSQPSTIFNG